MMSNTQYNCNTVDAGEKVISLITHNAVVTPEIQLFQNYLRSQPPSAVTCEIKH